MFGVVVTVFMSGRVRTANAMCVRTLLAYGPCVVCGATRPLRFSHEGHGGVIGCACKPFAGYNFPGLAGQMGARWTFSYALDYARKSRACSFAMNPVLRSSP